MEEGERPEKRGRSEGSNDADEPRPVDHWERTFQAVNVGISLIDADGTINRCNRAMEEFVGLTSGEIVGRRCFEVVHGAQGHIDDCPLPRMLRSKRRETMELKVGQKWFHVAVDPILGEDGEVRQAIHLVTDITAQRRTLEELAEERDRARNYLDLAAELIVALDREGRITTLNRSGARLLGCELDEALGADWFASFIPEGARAAVRRVFGELMAGKGEPSRSFENEVVTRSGERRLIRWHNGLIRDREGAITGALSAGEDVTEERLLREQLQQTQKMESIGTLAGGIAHDFNNILTAILGHASLLKLELEPGSEAFEYARIIEQASERAAELTSQLLGFARKGKFRKVPVDLHQTIMEVVRLIGRTFDKNVVLRLCLESRHPVVEGDPAQLQQVLMNLALNARDAMPAGGELEFTTSDERQPKADPWVLVKVRDTGHGILREHLDRIFEPFFTTKEAGSGSGMGLAMVYGIVENHGGRISVESASGRGATFSLRLPVHDGPPTPTPRPRDSGGPASARVLAIDDDPAVLETLRRMLERAGYLVVTFTDPVLAIRYFGQHAEEVDLVLIDMVMPFIDGGQCYRELRSIRSDLKAVLSSGYSIDERAQQILDLGMNGFIQKPYSPSALVSTVEAVLGEPS